MGAHIWWLALATLVLSVVLVRVMRRAFARFRSQEQKAGKEQIYRHFPKMKKPLGGGVAVFAALTAGVILAQVLAAAKIGAVEPSVWVWLACGLAFAGIGFVDDWRKVNAARGLDERAKLLLQIAMAVIFTLLILNVRHEDTALASSVYVPFLGWLPPWRVFFIPFGALVLVSASNAVNLTDGIDGLAGSTLALSFIGYLALAAIGWPGVPPLAPAVAVAALLGFLALNRPPARIIMGDTGALGLGAALGALALISRTEWLLIVFAAPFIIDTVSVLIQVSVIRFFRGPVVLLRHRTTEIFRPFLCTPLHHHFQWLTWGPWPILALFNGVGLVAILLGILAAPAAASAEAMAYAWCWAAGLGLIVGFLVFAAGQKAVRANYFLGLEPTEAGERMLTLYKGLPMVVLGRRWHQVEELTEITEGMVTSIAAESILWRNVSEIEARATLGKIYAEYRMTDRAAAEWEQIPLRNLLVRESLVVQLGKIYYGREEFLRAIKLWEQLPPARLAEAPGLPETIQRAKVRMGHVATQLYHEARTHALTLKQRVDDGLPGHAGASALLPKLEAALRYTQELRDLLDYERHKAESAAGSGPDEGQDLYLRMDGLLATRREELVQALRWAQRLASPAQVASEDATLLDFAKAAELTASQVAQALGATGPLEVREFGRIDKPSRNALFRVLLGTRDTHLPERLVVKRFVDGQVTFFAACYRRERGVLTILQDAEAPTPRLYGGHLDGHQGVLFLEDVGGIDLASALRALPADDAAGRVLLLKRGLDALVGLRVHAQPFMGRLHREIGRIVKEVLTAEYYLNATAIALGRIMALDGRPFSHAMRGQLEQALRPLLQPLLDAPRTFIHFEYTPGNLQYVDGKVIALDFEQATLGPAAFDLATLLYTPEARLTPEQVADLAEYYHDQLPGAMPDALVAPPDTLDAAAAIKALVYAGAAANFYRKYNESERLTAMDWYLAAAERILARRPDCQALAQMVHGCWRGQTHLVV